MYNKNYTGQKYNVFIIVIAFIMTLRIFFSGAVYAQVPPSSAVDRATKEVDRPMREEIERKYAPLPEEIPKEKEKEEEEEEIEGMRFFAKKINLLGAVSVSADKFSPIIEKYENKEISIKDLNILAREIEREYLRRGIIAACFIPPQDIRKGIVVLQVVEARMGELNIKDHSFFEKDRITHYWAIKPGEILRYDKMSRSIQLINKNPDREANITLHAGKKPGTTDVLLEVKTHFPIHTTFSLDREGSPTTGRLKTGFGIKHNNLSFIDDTLMTGFTVSQSSLSKYIYHSIPITNFGTGISYGYSDSHSQPKKEWESFALNSRSQNSNFFIKQDIYKGAEYLGDVSVGLDANDKVTHTQVQGTYTKDRFRTARLKSTFIHQYPGNITYIMPELSQGVNMFGAKSRNPLSSRNTTADNNFTKFSLEIRHKKSLPLNVQASLNIKSQVTSEKLASQEQLSLGGIDSVRGYPSGDFSADWGVQTNVELLIPSFWIPEKLKIPYDVQPLKDAITGVVFFDQGYGKNRGILVTEADDASLASVGAGLRIRAFNQALLRLEWGFPIGDAPETESFSPRARFHFSLTFEDRFAEEMERVKKLLHEDRIKKLAWRLLNEELKKSDSLLRKKMYTYLYLARLAYEKGHFKIAKTYYGKIQKAGDSLYRQSRDYIKSAADHQKKLKDYNELATEEYEKGNIKEAKALWQKLKDEAKTKPFRLDL